MIHTPGFGVHNRPSIVITALMARHEYNHSDRTPGKSSPHTRLPAPRCQAPLHLTHFTRFSGTPSDTIKYSAAERYPFQLCLSAWPPPETLRQPPANIRAPTGSGVSHRVPPFSSGSERSSAACRPAHSARLPPQSSAFRSASSSPFIRRLSSPARRPSPAQFRAGLLQF